MLIGGIGYGILHQRTLQAKHDLDKARHKEQHREHLIEQAREAYKNKLVLDKAGSGADAGECGVLCGSRVCLGGQAWPA